VSESAGGTARSGNSRRRLVLAGLAGATLVASVGLAQASRRLVNSCRAALPAALAEHEIVQAAWQGIDPRHFLDAHVHLVGIGDGGSGIEVNPRMSSLFHPLQYAQKLFYLNAGCVHDAPGQVDRSYVERLRNLIDGLLPGAGVLLFAFDRFHHPDGRADPARSSFHTPNAYARAIAARHPGTFAWAASIHPYRTDAVEALSSAVAGGACAVKWLPPAMGIDPSSPLCDRFYAALADHDLPLITHAGEEKAVDGDEHQAYGNPLLLRRALDHGVRVVVAHCASIGRAIDLDRGAHGPSRPCFELFTRLMDETRDSRRLFADISALTLRNRDPAVLATVLEREDWHPRLINGSDYPLPGIVPLILPDELAQRGLLPTAAVPVLDEIRHHNPLLFDFVLKRQLSSHGHRFASRIFETRPFFATEVTARRAVSR